jgi:hypothetical protein
MKLGRRALFACAVVTAWTAPAVGQFSSRADATGREVEIRLRRCAEVMRAPSATPAQLREALGVARSDGGGGGKKFEGPGFSVTFHRREPSGALDVDVHLNNGVHLPWRLIKQWSPKWKTVVAGEYTLVEAALAGADAAAPVVATVELFLTPRDLNGPVFSVTLGRN